METYALQRGGGGRAVVWTWWGESGDYVVLFPLQELGGLFWKGYIDEDSRPLFEPSWSG